MFDSLISINFMVLVLLFVFATVVAVNILAAIISRVLDIYIKVKKL